MTCDSSTNNPRREKMRLDALTPALRSRELPLELYDNMNEYESKTPEDWLKWCAEYEANGQPSADVLHLRDGQILFLPCSVRSYLAINKKFLVIVPGEGPMIKRVPRLRIRFRCEDPANFSARVDWAKECRGNAFQKMELDHWVRVKCREFGFSMPLCMKQRVGDMCLRTLKYLLSKSQMKKPQKVLGVAVKRIIQGVKDEFSAALTKHALGIGQSEFHMKQRIMELTRKPQQALIPTIPDRSHQLTRRLRFSILVLRSLRVCWVALGEALTLRLLITDWSRHDPRIEVNKLVYSGRGCFRIRRVKSSRARVERRSSLRRNSNQFPGALRFTDFAEQSRVYQRGVSNIVNCYWREFARRDMVDNLGVHLDFLQTNMQAHLHSEQHSVFHMFDVMVGHKVSQWVESCLEEWVERIEEAKLTPTIRIEIDLDDDGRVVLSPSQGKILETFESFIAGIESFANTFYNMESRLFPHSGVEKESLVVVDPELLTSSRERIRSVLVEDLREAHKLVDAYSVHVGPISELLAPCIAADDLDASRDFVSQCSQYVDAVGQVCPGGIRTQLFFVDTSTVVRKFAAAIRKVSQDFLVSTAEQLDETAQEIGYIYRGLEQYFNVPEDDYEAEKLLRAVENIAERTLDPLEENIAELVDVLNFLDHSQFLVSLDLRVEIYHLLSTAPDVRADLRQLCEDLKSREGQQSEGIDPDD